MGMMIALRDFAAAHRSVILRLEAPLAVRDARQALEAMPGVDWAFYAEKAEQPVQSEEFGRGAQVTLLTLCGNPRRLAYLPVRGSLPVSQADCAIDRGSALRLWGSADVVGLSLVYGGETYRVSGMLEVDEPLLLLTADEDALIDTIALSDADGYAAAQSLSGMLGGAAIAVDAEALAWLRLLPWAVAFAALLAGVSAIYRRHPPRWARKIALPAAIAVIACAAAALAIGAIPVRLLPNRWSDFAAYAGIFGGGASPLGDAASLRGAWLRGDAAACVLWGVGAAVAGVWGVRGWRRKKL